MTNKRLKVIGLLLLCTVCGHTQENMNRFIDQLMSRMTLDEKIGQLNLCVEGGFVAGENKGETRANSKEERIARGEIGGLFGMRGAGRIREWQRIAVEKSRLKIPLLFGLDIIHGYDVTFPIPLALASTWDMEMIEKVARASALEASSDGVCWAFSPMVDICRDARWGRIAESAGEDPYLGAQIAKAWVKGYQTDNNLSRRDNIMACVKHFALYGAAESGRDYNTVDMSRQRAFNEYMLPYQAAIEQGVGSVMASFNEFEGIPATGNKYLMDEVLRKLWKFNGLLVSDYTGVMEMKNHGVGDELSVSALALQAGINMDMCSEYYSLFLKEALHKGLITEKDIDINCRYVLEAKYKLGLFEDPYRYCNEELAKKRLGKATTVDLARRAAQESIVLLKNEHQLLPLQKNMHIALIGPMGARKNDMIGTWGGWSEIVKPISLLEGLEAAVIPHGGSVTYAEGSWLLDDKKLEETIVGSNMGFTTSDGNIHKVHEREEAGMIAEALEKAREADVVIAALGENINMNGEGTSRSNPSIPEPQKHLLKALFQTGKPIVLVTFTGRPLVLSWEEEHIPAILNAWFPGVAAGNALADIIFGDFNPCGKLTASFPRNVGQIPIYYNHKNTGRPVDSDFAPYVRFKSNYIDTPNAPLYPFGYGLSYTNFEYDNVTLSTNQMRKGDVVTASVNIRNTGKRKGKETVQLYIHDVYSTSTRPVMELKGFKQVELEPDESTIVEFQLSEDMLKYYNHQLEYVCEPGDFEIMIGPDSRNVKKSVITFK